MSVDKRKIDEYGNVFIDYEQLIDSIFSGNFDSFIPVEKNSDVVKYNLVMKKRNAEENTITIYKKPDISVEEFHKERQKEWIISDFENYKNLDIRKWFYSKIKTEERKSRVDLEIKKFEENNMVDFIRFLICLVDNFKKNNIIWGVGRGSSTCLYTLYLIGIHKVNSLKYNLCISDFFK